jgi:micrococcal nuclease
MFREGLKMLSGIVMAFVILFLVSRVNSANNVSVISNTNSAQVVDVEATSTPADTFQVSRVIDGDTIVVNINGKNETIRLIGVNTPETVDPRKPVQCFGKEASNFVKNMLTGQSVRLQSDPTQSDRDKYGRLLRYVYLGDVLVDEELISSGYGFEYTYDVPYMYQKEFKASEAYARGGQLGLWSPDSCDGKLEPAK